MICQGGERKSVQNNYVLQFYVTVDDISVIYVKGSVQVDLRSLTCGQTPTP